MKTITRCEYLIPGAFLSEDGNVEVEVRNATAALAKLPRNAFAFRFVTLTYLSAIDELGNEFETKPTRSDESGWYYPDGIVYDLADVEALAIDDPDRYRILASNMRANGWARIVCCRTRNWQPFTDADQLVTTP